ncbi:MAG: hypothetical protein R3344_00190 [Acidobacteriota bacterium]|nr:hypothetical protein [Acidobacteriota bacterium]
MKLRTLTVPRTLALAFGILLVFSASAGAAKEEVVTLQGDIETAEYDDDGNVSAVSVYDGDWGSVLIRNHGKGAELSRHVGAVAKVTGTIVELDDDSGYSYAITATSYTIVTPAESEEEDPEDWDPDE